MRATDLLALLLAVVSSLCTQGSKWITRFWSIFKISYVSLRVPGSGAGSEAGQSVYPYSRGMQGSVHLYWSRGKTNLVESRRKRKSARRGNRKFSEK